MLTLEEEVRLRVAAGVLFRRGLLALEDDPGRADVVVGSHGYRYLSHFWAFVGVVQAKSVALESDRDVAHARRRIAEAWIEAGAPAGWAEQEAAAALGLVGVPAPAVVRAAQRLARAASRTPLPRPPKK
jgi:hypothetical protein